MSAMTDASWYQREPPDGLEQGDREPVQTDAVAPPPARDTMGEPLRLDGEVRQPEADPRPPGRRGLLVAWVLAPLFVALVAAVSFVAGASAERAGLVGRPSQSTTTGDANLALVEQAWDLLHTKYVAATSLDSKKMAYAAISGMTDAVGDTGHTAFFTPDDLAASQAALSGSYAGIGAEMDATGDQPVVVGVFRDTPADRAGLRPGDVVVEVNGVATKGTPLDVVVSKVRGPAGTPVTLTVTRAGSTEPITFTITRAQVDIPTVEYAMVPGTTIAVIRVEQFSSNAADIFKQDLQKLLGEHPTGLVLDLRGDPGGYVTDAVTVASQFLTEGVVYRQRDASLKETSTPVEKGALAPTIPLVVLVDGGTASAAEIVTGALQDPKRATIVGVRTFGTGTVLATYDLPDGSALRIGTVEWLTPNGHQIWHHGLVPDVIVGLTPDIRPVIPDDLRSMTPAQLKSSPDAQIRKAIELLLGHPL